jgi:phage baseplate assembly protein W
MRALCVPFRVDGAGNLMWTTDIARVWDDRVQSVLGTLHGVRLHRPSFGISSTTNVLFEGRDEMHKAMEHAVREAFAQNLPTLALISVTSEYSDASGEDSVTVRYALPNGDNSQSRVTTPGTF